MKKNPFSKNYLYWSDSQMKERKKSFLESKSTKKSSQNNLFTYLITGTKSLFSRKTHVIGITIGALILWQSFGLFGNILSQYPVNFDFSTNSYADELDGYQLRFRETTRGGIIFTGNSIGLSTFDNKPNNPVNGSIDVYTTLNNSLQVPGWPSGTTLDWRQNGSSAVLDLPSDSLVLYAELIWGANFENDDRNRLTVESQLNTPVSLATPQASFSVSPDTTTASETDYGYVRTANVTDLIQPGGGTISVNGVPGIIDPADKSSNHAGWTLAVIYAQASLPIRNLTFYTGSESVFTNRRDGNTVAITGFGTPLQGEFESKIFISTQEGDSDFDGDQLLFGNSENSLQPLSGPNNLGNNFFASQINNNNGQLDTRGSFGNRNQDLGVSNGGRRQGWDITTVNVSDRMQNGQTRAYLKGTSSNDIYVINGLGVQIDVNAPNPSIEIVRDKEFVRVGETIRYDISITNDGIIDGKNATISSLIPEGTVLVPGTLFINGQPSPLNPATGLLQIYDIVPGQTQTVSFEVQVGSIPDTGVYENEATVSYQYTPVAGSEPVVDDKLSSKVVTFPLTPIGLPPVANDDNAITRPSTPVTINVPQNDTDPENSLNIESVIIKTPPPNGTVTVNRTTGETIYTPNDGFTGIDTYEYTICDIDGNCDDAIVSVTVRPLQPPVAENDSARTKQGVPVSIPTLNNDSDPLNEVINPTNQINILTPPVHGTITVDQNTRETIYTPTDPTFVGEDTYEYELCNIDDCEPAIVTVTITERIIPVAVDDAGTTKQGIHVTIPILSNDTPGNGAEFDRPTFQIVEGQEPQNGTISLDPNTGQGVYTPNPNFTGPDTFQYTICNNQDECDTATVTITVEPFVPPTANDDNSTTDENTPVTIPVLTNDTPGDASINPTTVTIVPESTPQNGTATPDTETGEILYTPNPGFSGTDTFTYRVCDENDKCDTAVVTVNVTPTLPPTANDDNSTTDENTPVTIPVLTNDTPGDLPIDPERVRILPDSLPQNGTATPDPETGEIVYTPNPGYDGPDTFIYEVCDDQDNCDTATVTINVNPLLPPEANLDTATTFINVPVIIPILNNDVDELDGISPADFDSIIVGEEPDFGTAVYDSVLGVVTYTPDEDFVGSDTFVYRICNSDGCDEAIVTVNISALASPDALNDSARTPSGQPVEIPILSNDSPGDGRQLAPDTLELTNTRTPQGGTVTMTPNKTFIYTPNNGFSGEDSFSYKICNDQNQCDEAIVVVQTDPLPLPPRPDAVDDNATTQMNQPVVIPIYNNDTLPEGTNPRNVTFPLDPIGGTVRQNPDNTVTYTPNPRFTGQDRFVYSICSAPGLCDSAEVLVNILPPNQQLNPPVNNQPNRPSDNNLGGQNNTNRGGSNTQPRRQGQVLGAFENLETTPRTGALEELLVNIVIISASIITFGFFGSLYFIKVKQKNS